MKLIALILFIITVLTTQTFAHEKQDLSISPAAFYGMWPANENVNTSYLYYSQVSDSDIKKIILKSNKAITEQISKTYAFQIISASSCYEIDPVYLTALIKKESRFALKAKSKTGAAGLTQMTGSGIKELRDQLGVRGNKYARKSNISFFISTTQKCLGNDWTEFKNLFYTKTNTQIKSSFYNNSKFSIFAGAMLLKVYLANASGNCSSCSIPELYTKALEQYNGDTHKKSYAQKINNYVLEWMK